MFLSSPIKQCGYTDTRYECKHGNTYRARKQPSALDRHFPARRCIRKSEAITKSGLTPSASYTGIETANDFVLAFQIDSTQTKESQWIVCADHVKEHSGSLNATTEDAQYIRTGNVTEKTGTQRTLAVNGDRCVGDAFQDFVLSHKIVYGTGSDIIVPYIYFSLRTGKGEKGSAAIIVTSDVGGAAGSKATFACDVKAVGTPDEFTFAE